MRVGYTGPSKGGVVGLTGTLLALLLCACATPEPEAGEDEPASELAEAEPEEERESVQARRRRRRLERERAITFVSSFPHDPHGGITCERCHDTADAHDTHRVEVGCADCHTSPASMTTPTDAECLACHHEPEQTLACVDCHAADERYDGPITVVLSIGAQIASTRDLTFEHPVHEDLDCAACHIQPPTYATSGGCVDCHVEHHQPASDCVACHGSAPVAEHDVDVHRGCGGSGCHVDPTVLALPQNRGICLSCHQEQLEHEAPQECNECHTAGSSQRPDRETLR